MSVGTVVFILSSDHSGSTWLGYVLGSTSNAVFVGEFWRAWDDNFREPCSFCYASGIESCEVLNDIQRFAPERAHELVCVRAKKQFIIDSSKRLGWAQKLMAKIGLKPYLIHLVRDPRGWYASQRRRRHEGREELIQ